MANLTTVTFDEKDKSTLLELVQGVQQAQRIVVIVGAGISTDAGIPVSKGVRKRPGWHLKPKLQDFRSKSGLYQQYGPAAFDQSVYSTPESASKFLTTLVSMKAASDGAEPTTTHRMIAELNARGSLQRCYTQNIDGLDARLLARPFPPLDGIAGGRVGPLEHNCVMLHGCLQLVWCTKCRDVKPWLPEHTAIFKNGTLAPCSCGLNESRPSRIARSGVIKPLIALYEDQDYPYQDTIQTIIQTDCTSPPDLVMVMGTSLKVQSVQNLIRDMARNASKVIFVNIEAPQSTAESLFTHHVRGKTDDWAGLILDPVDAVEELAQEQPMGAALEQPTLVDTSTHEMATEQVAITDEELRFKTVSEILECEPITPRWIDGVLVTEALLRTPLTRAWEDWIWGDIETKRRSWQIQEIYRIILLRTGRRL